MKQLSTEFDKWMNYCEHTNTLWFEVLKYWLRLLYLASLIYHEMLKIILNILCSIQPCIDICMHSHLNNKDTQIRIWAFAL